MPCIIGISYHFHEIMPDSWQLKVRLQVWILVGLVLLEDRLVGGKVVHEALLSLFQAIPAHR